MQKMTAATAALSYAAADVAPVAQAISQRLRAPCLGLAVMAGAALWVGIGSTFVLLVA
jgi:hypothetical protein